MFLIGRHVGIHYSLLESVRHAHDIHCQIMQIFLGPPTQITVKAKSKADLARVGDELNKYKIILVIHGSYAINLCHPAGSNRFTTSVNSLVKDLKSAEVIGKRCLGVIIHMGKNVNKLSVEHAIMNYVMGLRDALEATASANIILEMGASQGTEVASRISGLKKIFWSLDKHERRRIKFCVDTCHIWATGYDISTVAGVKKFFDEFDEAIGIKSIVCVHFNDSQTPLGSHVDRHADLGQGYIGTVGLKAFARIARRYQIPLIMETPLNTIDVKTKKPITFADEKKTVTEYIKKK